MKRGGYCKIGRLYQTTPILNIPTDWPAIQTTPIFIITFPQTDRPCVRVMLFRFINRFCCNCFLQLWDDWGCTCVKPIWTGRTKFYFLCMEATHTPSIVFRHLLPNSARFGYATEWALFISTPAVHRCGRCPPKCLGTNHTPSTVSRHLPRPWRKDAVNQRLEFGY